MKTKRSGAMGTVGRGLGALWVVSLAACSGKGNIQATVQAPPDSGATSEPTPTRRGLTDSAGLIISIPCQGVSGVFSDDLLAKCRALASQEGRVCEKNCIDPTSYRSITQPATSKSAPVVTKAPVTATTPSPAPVTSPTPAPVTGGIKPEFQITCKLLSDAPCFQSQGGPVEFTFVTGTVHKFVSTPQTWSGMWGLKTSTMHMEVIRSCWVDKAHLSCQ